MVLVAGDSRARSARLSNSRRRVQSPGRRAMVGLEFFGVLEVAFNVPEEFRSRDAVDYSMVKD